MSHLNIRIKIWLSIGIFVLGFVLSTILGQVQGHSNEASLRITSEALFPAAQGSQEAEASFERMVKGFSDSILIEDASALEQAARDGQRVADGLNAVSAIPGLPPE